VAIEQPLKVSAQENAAFTTGLLRFPNLKFGLIHSVHLSSSPAWGKKNMNGVLQVSL
jgi:hypothetical protein